LTPIALNRIFILLPKGKGKIMAKRKLNLAKLAASLTAKQLEQLQQLLKGDPKVKKLEAKRDEIAMRLAAIDRQIAEAKGKTPKRRGRPRGRPRKNAAAPVAPKARRMRKGKRKTVTSAKVTRSKAPKKKTARTPEQQAAINARMAKARAARKINLAKAAE